MAGMLKVRTFEDAVRRHIKATATGTLSAYGLAGSVELVSSGRLFRSRIAYYSHAGGDRSTLVELCAAMELLHAATLIQDDVIDRAGKRRGLRTVHADHGEPAAVLAGNLLVRAALQQVAEPAGVHHLPNFLHAYEAVNGAQLREWQHRMAIEKSLDSYLAVVDGKTVSMILLAVRLGAGVVDPNDDRPIIKFFHHIGVAFQLVDDIEDIEEWLTGPSTERTKCSRFDVENGIYTAPTIFAAQRLLPDGASDIRSFDPRQIGWDDWQRGIDEARGLVREQLGAARSLLSVVAAEVGQESDLIRFGEDLIQSLSDESLDLVVSS